MRTLFLFFLVAFASQLDAQSHKVDSLKLLLKNDPIDTNRVGILLELSRIQTFVSAEDAFQSADQALELSSKINYKSGQVQAYMHIAYYYDHSGKSIEAVDALFKSLKISNEIGDQGLIAKICNLIGLIYISQEDMEMAMDYFNKALQIWEDMNYKQGIAMALENMADVQQYELKDTLALDNYMKSLKIAEEINDKFRKGSVLNAVGKIHAKRGEYYKALEYQKQAFSYSMELGSPIMLSRVFQEMSNVSEALGKYDEALDFALKASENASRVNSKRDVANSYYSIFKAYKAQENYQKALEYLSLYQTLYDSLKNFHIAAKIHRVEYLHEIDALQKEQKVSLFKKNAIIGIFALLFIILFLIYKRKEIIVEKRLALKQQQLLYNRQQLTDRTNHIVERSKTIDLLNQQLELLKEKLPKEDIQLINFTHIFQQNILTEKDWIDFKSKFDVVYPGFFVKLRFYYSDISEAELRIAALLRLKLSLKESAAVLAISPESVRKARYRFKKKMGLSKEESLDAFVENLSTSKSPYS